MMRLKATLAVLGLFAFALPATASACPQLLKHSFTPLMGGVERSLCQYQDKVVLVVNTASGCGFTPQFERLEALHRKYQERGLVVLGFPSNDFGGQEPGTARQIAEFCRVNYGVSFPIFGKTVVSGTGANSFYVALGQASGATPGWNFHKYLVDRSGTRVESFASSTAPDSPAFVAAIERLLATR
jgi:glutathione peroxidase